MASPSPLGQVNGASIASAKENLLIEKDSGVASSVAGVAEPAIAAAQAVVRSDSVISLRSRSSFDDSEDHSLAFKVFFSRASSAVDLHLADAGRAATAESDDEVDSSDGDTGDFDAQLQVELQNAGTKTPPCRATPPPGVQQTPEATRQAARVIQDEGMFNSPDKSGKKMVRRGVMALQKTHEQEQEEGAAENAFSPRKARKLVHHAVGLIAPDHDQASSQFHIEASERLEQEGGLSRTSKDYLQGLAKIGGSPARVIPARHIAEYDPAKGGGHLYDPDKMHVIAKNSITGVMYVSIEGEKLSSVFPEGTNLDIIVRLVHESDVIGRRGNQSLRMTKDGYMIECYANSPISFSSVFPVFMYEEFTLEHAYQLTQDVQLTSEQILDAVRQRAGMLFQYSVCQGDQVSSTSLIIDVAPLFKDRTRVEKGIMFKFDKATAPFLFSGKRKQEIRS